MLVSFEQRVGYVEIIVKGVFGEKDAPEVSTRFETFIAGSPPEDATWACALLNLREATLVAKRVFAVIAGYAVLLRLKGKPTVVGWPPEVVRGFIEESKTRELLAPARDEAEAFQLMLWAIPREYSADFYAFLVNGQYLTKDQLRSLTQEHKTHGGKVPMERLLVDSKIFSWKTLLAAHVRFRTHKAGGAPAGSAGGEVTPAKGMFGAPAVLPAGARVEREPAPADPFAAALEASAALGEEEPVESEFVKPRLLGTILVQLKILSDAQLKEALERQRTEGRRTKLGDLLVRMGLVTDDQLFRALEQQFRRKRPEAGEAKAAGGRSEFVKRNLLGEILLELGLLSEAALKQALEEQRSSRTREKLGAVLLRLGLVTRDQIFTALEAQSTRKAGRSGEVEAGER